MASKRLKAIDERIEDASYYAINVPRYTVEFRHEISRDYTARRVNESAAAIVDSLYQEGARQYSNPALDERTRMLESLVFSNMLL